MFDFIGIEVIAERTYYRHVRHQIQPSIILFWEKSQKEILETFKENDG